MFRCMKRKNILIVNWGTPSSEYPLHIACSIPKYTVYLAATNNLPDSIKRLFPGDRHIITNPYDKEKLIKDVLIFSKDFKCHFDIVTTFFEMNVLQTAYLAEALNVIHYLPVKNAMFTSVDKLKMRTRLANVGIIQPKYISFNRYQLHTAYKFLSSIKQPVVIKPIHSGHSYGTRLIEDPGITFNNFVRIFNDAYEDINRNFDEWMDYENKTNIPYLLEEFIPGPVYSCNGIIGKTNEVIFISSAEFISTPPPLLQQIGHIAPIASLTDKQIAQSKVYTKKVITHLGLQYCGFHCEFKYYNHQPVLLEISGRLPGGEVLSSLQNTSSIDIINTFFEYFLRPYIIKIHRKYKSECVCNKFIPRKFIYIRSITQPKKTIIPYQINSNMTGCVLRSRADGEDIWVYRIRLWSQNITSKQLWRQAYILKNIIKVDYSSSGIMFSLYKYKILLNDVLKRLQHLMNKTVIIFFE